MNAELSWKWKDKTVEISSRSGWNLDTFRFTGAKPEEVNIIRITLLASHEVHGVLMQAYQAITLGASPNYSNAMSRVEDLLGEIGRSNHKLAGIAESALTFFEPSAGLEKLFKAHPEMVIGFAAEALEKIEEWVTPKLEGKVDAG